MKEKVGKPLLGIRKKVFKSVGLKPLRVLQNSLQVLPKTPYSVGINDNFLNDVDRRLICITGFKCTLIYINLARICTYQAVWPCHTRLT